MSQDGSNLDLHGRDHFIKNKSMKAGSARDQPTHYQHHLRMTESWQLFYTFYLVAGYLRFREVICFCYLRIIQDIITQATFQTRQHFSHSTRYNLYYCISLYISQRIRLRQLSSILKSKNPFRNYHPPPRNSIVNYHRIEYHVVLL